MVINSMTGYGRGVSEIEGLTVEIEMKSVNHKYLDINVRLPKFLNPLEQKIKKRIQETLARGRIDVYINLDTFGIEETEVRADMTLGKAVVDALSKAWSDLGLKREFDDAFNVGNLMSIPNFLSFESKELDEDLLEQGVFKALDQSLNTLCLMRQTEGKQLIKDLSVHLEELESVANAIEKRAPVVLEEYQQKLFEKMKDWTGNLTPDKEARLGMEIVLYADKSDINEEVARLFSHIQQFYMILENQGAIGKQLDFLCQEMNREVNTMGSKSNDIEITNAVILGKTAIEKIREQVQNIE